MKLKTCPDCGGSGSNQYDQKCRDCEGNGEVSTVPRYKTDGRLIESSEGGFMGIFSTVSLLNDKEIMIDKMRTCLEEMANEDFRGNRNPLSVKAFQCLKEMGLIK